MPEKKITYSKSYAGVSTQNPEYTYRSKQWKEIRDCVEGNPAIKRAGEVYLPRMSGMTDPRYEAYKNRAIFVNYVEQTLMGTHGMIFRRRPTVEIPKQIEDIINNIDRKGNSLYQFLSDSVLDMMQTCFGGFLIDVSAVGTNLTVFEADKQGIRPYVTYYKAESIINWKFKVVNGTMVPRVVVLKELVEENPEDMFSHELVEQYRVLCFDENDNYQQLLIRVYESQDKDEEPRYEVEERPFFYKNKKIKYIPFVFAPYDVPEKPMLLDIADVNIGHYMMTADYKNGVHLTTLPTGYTTGHKPEVDANGNVMPVLLGADQFLQLEEEGAKVGILNYSGEGLTHNENALNSAELQMVVLGSRIITPEKGISETAESANIHRAGENAKLASFANNVSDRITRVLKMICELEGIDERVSVQLCTDYETQGFDANTLNAMANIFSQGKMPLYVLYSMMMRGEFLSPDMTYEDYVTLLDLEASGMTPQEVFDSYKIFKQNGKVIMKKTSSGNNQTDNSTAKKTAVNPVNPDNAKVDGTIE